MKIPPQFLWPRFTSWFKTWQKSYNDWLFTPLAVLLFLQLPAWWNRWRSGDDMHGFASDTLMALPTALVMFCFASLIAYGMFRAQYPDMYDEFIRCNEKDLLKKVVTSDTEHLLDTEHYISHLQYRQAWRIHTESRAILFHYFWASVLLQAVIASTVPSLPSLPTLAH